MRQSRPPPTPPPYRGGRILPSTESAKCLNVPHLIDIKTHTDPRGALGAIEAEKDAGFAFRRLYFLYDIQEGATRGAHAHKALSQCMIALSGQFTVHLEGKGAQHDFVLSTPEKGLIIPPGYWRELSHFTQGAVCLVAASHVYEEDDYIRNYEMFLEWDKCREA